VKRRFLSAVVVIILAFQVINPSPVIAATDVSTGTMDCMTVKSHCPDCPNGPASHCNCPELCVSSVAISADVKPLVAQIAIATVADAATTQITSQIYSPVNPPPIR
jgi:hypothetical protein